MAVKKPLREGLFGVHFAIIFLRRRTAEPSSAMTAAAAAIPTKSLAPVLGFWVLSVLGVVVVLPPSLGTMMVMVDYRL